MKKNLLITFLCLSFGFQSMFAQDFYDINTIQEIKISFSQPNWDALLDQLKANDEEAYLLTDSVVINGVVFDSIGVKYKGNSTYNANNQKNPLHIELDYVHGGAAYQGYSDVKLGNGVADPTFVREALSYEILSDYMEAPRANFAKLWINGVYWGLFSNQEAIKKSFIKDHLYTSGNNPFFKCNPVGGAGPGTSGSPDLVYSSADSTAYYSKYEMKSDYGWAQLLTLMSTLKNNPSQIESILDVDRTLWMLAFNDVLVNLDSYTGAFAQNYYLYQDENGRFVPFVWDLNMSFGGFTMLTSGGGNSLNISQMQQMDPLIQSTNANRPLIQKLLAIPTYKRQYLAHIRTLLSEHFADSEYRIRALELQAIIDQAVQADTKKFYTYQNFINNIDNQSTGGGGIGGNVPGLTQLMNARYTYLNSTTVLSALSPQISAVTATPAIPASGQTVWITATATDATAITLGYRDQFWTVFQKITMLDDGAHEDGTAGDGVYGASIVASTSEIQYYVYAENGNAGRFSPERAEFEFYKLNTESVTPPVGQVVINEFLASNQTGAVDEFNEHEDWVELFNRTNTTFDLGGLWLTDNIDNPNKFKFPTGSVIAPNGYLIVWLDEDGVQGSLHANFKLSNGGEFLMLSDSTGVVYDSLTFGPQTADVSYGRYPNGTGPFQSMPTTFAAVNSLTSAVNDPAQQALFQLYPNPAGEYLEIESAQPLGEVSVQNVFGQVIMTIDGAQQQQLRIALNGLAPGMYWLRVPGVGVRAFVRGE